MACQPAGHLAEQQPCDGLDLLAVERLEDDDLVDPVQELGTEAAPQHLHDVVADLVELVPGLAGGSEPERLLALEAFGAEVRRS